MKFRNITIPAEGRNKYGNYTSSTELSKTVVRVTYNGDGTTGGNKPKPPQEEYQDARNIFLSRTSLTFGGEDLMSKDITETIDIIGYINSKRGDTFIGDISVGIPEEDVYYNNSNYDMTGFAEKGMSFVVKNNGTQNTQLILQVTKQSLENTSLNGTILIPCSIYGKSDDTPLGDVLNDWCVEVENCTSLVLELSWNITPIPASNVYRLELSNEIAGINCDANGNIYSNAVKPTCTATLYYGSEIEENATYGITYGDDKNVMGVSIHTTTGEITFGNNFSFSGSMLELNVYGSVGGQTITKIMTICKQYQGVDGTSAITRWIVPSVNSILHNPNNDVLSPNKVTCKVMEQEGDNAPTENTDITIYYGFDTDNPVSIYSSGVDIIDSSKSYLAFALKNEKNEVYEIETIPILKDGKNGEDGKEGTQGRQGAAIRGPIDWKNVTTSRRWCNGTLTDENYPEDAEFIDVVMYNGEYYKCHTSYNGTGSEIEGPSLTYWMQTDKQYEFVSTSLVLADNAKIKFSSNNELYLTDDEGTVTAGAAGGDGVSFWAGSENPDDGKFKVEYDGTMEATKGKFGAFNIGNITDELHSSKLISDVIDYYDDAENVSIYTELAPHYYGVSAVDINNPDKSVSIQIAPNTNEHLGLPNGDESNGFIEVKLGDDVRKTASSNIDIAFSTNGKVQAPNFCRGYEGVKEFVPFMPLADFKITFVTDTNYFSISNGEWYWNNNPIGYDASTYKYVKIIDGEWTAVYTSSSSWGVGLGIYSSSHTKQNNRLYIEI